MKKVFVYGTLKRGRGNYKVHLRDQEYLGSDVTVDKYIMGDVGFPYVFPASFSETYGLEDFLCPVRGDVFMVTDECLSRLDRLEGVPSHYERIQVETVSNGTAWMYIQPDPTALYGCYQVNVNDEGEYEW